MRLQVGPTTPRGGTSTDDDTDVDPEAELHPPKKRSCHVGDASPLAPAYANWRRMEAASSGSSQHSGARCVGTHLVCRASCGGHDAVRRHPQAAGRVEILVGLLHAAALVRALEDFGVRDVVQPVGPQPASSHEH